MNPTLDLTQISIDQLNQIQDLQELKEWTKGCTACTLRQESYQVTHSSGSLTSPIMFIGMNPGFCEDSTGIPFCGRAELATSRCASCQNYTTCFSWQTDMGATRPLASQCKGFNPIPQGQAPYQPPSTIKAGPYSLGGVRSAGQLLDDVLVSLGIERKNIFITNIALCKSAVGEPKPQHINSCARIRLRTEELLKPKVVVALGRLAIAQYTGKTVTISRMHGTPIHMPNFTLLPTYHPSAILRKMLAASQMTLEERAKATEDITNEKWALYNDLATGINLLSGQEIQSLLIPGTKLTNGKLAVKARP